MGALDDARAHLAKAREFLEAAQLNHELDLFDAATSNAVTSGINSKDAICLQLTGRTGRTDNHEDAAGELARSGPGGRQLAPTLRRLLKLKTRAQYLTAPTAASDAVRAIDWATRLLEGAQRVVTS